MPTSRFDININQPYQSVRIPLPLDYLAGIAKNMQGEHDQGVKAAEDFSKLGQAIKASPVGEGIKQQLIGEMKSDMENTYNSTKSYSSPDFQRKVQDLSNKWANDPRITYLKAEKDLFEQNQKDLADKNNSRDLNYTYSKFYNSSNGTYSQAKDINELPLSSRITKYADAYKTQADMMNNIAASAFDSSKGYDFSHPQSGVGPGGEYYAFNKVNNKVEKIDKNDIDRIVQASLPLYAKTDAGTYELQREAKKYIGDRAYDLDYDKLSELAQQDSGYTALKENIDQRFRQDLTNVGQKQIFTKSKYDVDNMTLADRNRQKDNDEKYNTDNTPIYLWNILTGEGVAPEKNMLNHTLESINSGFKFNNKGELEEKTSLESSYKDSNKVNSYTDKKTGVKYDLNNLPEGWKVKTNKHIKEQQYDIIVNDKGEEINLTMKEYYGQFSHNFGTVSVKTYSPSEGYLKQQQEVLSFLKNSNQYDDKKSAQENYKSGIKLYGDAIKSGKLNAMSIPEFDAVTAKAFEDYYLPKFTENKDGALVLKDAGRTAQWSIEGIDKGTEDGQKEFNNIVAGSNIVGPDLSKGGSHVLLNTRGGKMVSVNLNNQTLAANFEALSNFNKKNNEAIYLPNKSKTIKDFSEATLTNKKQVSTLDDMQNQMLNLTQEYSPADIQEVGASLEKDRHNIDNISLTLKKNNYQPLNTYYDKESNTIGMSFINRQDPNNPDIKVIHYQPGTEPTLVSNAVFNRDIYQKLFGKIAVNMSDKSNNFTGKQLKTQKPR